MRDSTRKLVQESDAVMAAIDLQLSQARCARAMDAILPWGPHGDECWAYVQCDGVGLGSSVVPKTNLGTPFVSHLPRRLMVDDDGRGCYETSCTIRSFSHVPNVACQNNVDAARLHAELGIPVPEILMKEARP